MKYIKLPILILNLIFLLFSENLLASKLSEEFINLDELYGEERRQARSLISKRKHFNKLIDNERYEEALEYSSRILDNLYHTPKDQQIFKDLKKGLQSISAMRQNFQSKIKEKEYDYARRYLTERILNHPYHIESDKHLIKLVKKKGSKRSKAKTKQVTCDDDIITLTELMQKNCYIGSASQKKYRKETKERGFSRQFPFESSGSNYLSYINDLLPDQW